MKPKTFVALNVFANVIAVLLLLFLFIYPSARLTDLIEHIERDLNMTVEGIETENWTKAADAARHMKETYYQRMDGLKLYIDHEDVDALEAKISGMVYVVEHQEAAEALFELENIRSLAKSMLDIERLTIYSLF